MPTTTPALPLLRSYRVHWHRTDAHGTRTSTPLTIMGRELDAEEAREVMAGLLDVAPDVVVVDRVQLVATMGADLDEEPEPAPADPCERCKAEPITDQAAGLGDACSANNDARVTV